jgi:hypothetical protein
MLSIMFTNSKYYVDNLSQHVKRGIRNKVENGWLSRLHVDTLMTKRQKLSSQTLIGSPLSKRCGSLCSPEPARHARFGRLHETRWDCGRSSANENRRQSSVSRRRVHPPHQPVLYRLYTLQWNSVSRKASTDGDLGRI